MDNMPKKLELTGMGFGNLKVIEFAGMSKHYTTTWRCICVCGNEIVVLGSLLVNGDKKSCGCEHSLVGMTFGRLTVIKKLDGSKRGNFLWECLCDCGKTTVVMTSLLKGGYTRSCGCLNRDAIFARQFIDLSGMRFGKLVVISVDWNHTPGKAYWLCRCDCGKEKIISGSSLKQGITRSCGCFNSESIIKRCRVDLTGMKFEKLTVIRPNSSIDRKKLYWDCECECGNKTTVLGNNLRRGRVISCGCEGRKRGIAALIAKNYKHGKSNTKEYRIAYARKRKDMECALDGEWSLDIEAALKSLFTSCVVCGSTDHLQVDHVYPLHLGYGLKPGNATILCRKHNISKHHKLPEDLPDHMRIPILESAARFKEYWESLQTKMELA